MDRSLKPMLLTEAQMETLDSMKIERGCCRTMFLTHVELIDTCLEEAELYQTRMRSANET